MILKKQSEDLKEKKRRLAESILEKKEKQWIQTFFIFIFNKKKKILRF